MSAVCQPLPGCGAALQSMLDEWLLCQGKWLYLEPIFSAEEIMKQIPTEGAAFRAMDRTWRDIMQKVGGKFARLAWAVHSF